MLAAILFAILTGPLPEASPPTLTLKIHLGRDARSRIARHELECQHHHWVAQRIVIGRRHRLMFDDAANMEPTYQIGSGPREKFPPGSCAASGSFIRTLTSIATIDAWERESSFEYGVQPGGYWMYSPRTPRPDVFPPPMTVTAR